MTTRAGPYPLLSSLSSFTLVPPFLSSRSFSSSGLSSLPETSAGCCHFFFTAGSRPGSVPARTAVVVDSCTIAVVLAAFLSTYSLQQRCHLHPREWGSSYYR